MVQPRVVAGRQIYNWAIFQVYIMFLDDYRKANGKYPNALVDAVPGGTRKREMWLAGYRYALHYEAGGDRFLLASFGRDDIQDSNDYDRCNSVGRANDSPCYDANIETVYSTQGILQACGK